MVVRACVPELEGERRELRSSASDKSSPLTAVVYTHRSGVSHNYNNNSDNDNNTDFAYSLVGML